MEPVFERPPRIPTFVKVIAAIVLPIALTIGALSIFGLYLRENERIFPGIYIDGINVSGLTREEAIIALEVHTYQYKVHNAGVALVFPEREPVYIWGLRVGMRHTAHDRVEEAYRIGRQRGVFHSVITFFEQMERDPIELMVEFELDRDILRGVTDAISYEYMITLRQSTPQINDDYIIFTRGANYIRVIVDEVFLSVEQGLFDSLDMPGYVYVAASLSNVAFDAPDLVELLREIYIPVITAEFDRETMSATGYMIGVSFDLLSAKESISGLGPGESTAIPIITTIPQYTTQELDELLFRDLIGTMTTNVGGTYDRLHNVRLSSEAIDGYVILPGEEFSFNRIVGRRTAAAGYRVAPILVRGQLVPGIGGGICQTSSTLFAAIRTTELNFTERRPHGRPIGYLPWGWDATVSYGHIDFRFENNTNYPLLICMTLDGRRLTARVYGTIVDDFPTALER